MKQMPFLAYRIEATKHFIGQVTTLFNVALIGIVCQAKKLFCDGTARVASWDWTSASI